MLAELVIHYFPNGIEKETEIMAPAIITTRGKNNDKNLE